MFEKLIDLIIHLWDRLIPVEIVKEFEGGVVLRFGRYNRTINPGLIWKWPLIEEALTSHVCITTMRLPSQALVTKDGIQIIISAIVKYEIKDVKAFLLTIWDSVDVLADTTMGAIKEVVNTSTYEELVHPEVPSERKVLNTTREWVNTYGFKIHRVTFVDLSRAKTIKILQDVAHNNNHG